MRKRWLIGIPIIIVVLLVLAWMFPTSVFVSIGMVKGEATFDGKPTDYWAYALKKEGFLGQAPPPGDAGKTLRQGGAAAVPVLCQLASSPDDQVRSEALSTLSLMGAEAKGAVPMLKETLKTEKSISRFLAAAEALANADPAAAGETLGAVLREHHEDYTRQACAFASLLKMAPQGQEALPALKDLFNDQEVDPVLRVQAIDVLWHLKQPAEPMVPGLCDMVAAPQSVVGVQALMVLGQMGPSAKSAVPTLLEVLARPDLPLMGKRWGPPSRTAVYRTLGQIGPDARAAVPVLLASLGGDRFFARRSERNNYYVRTEAGLALARMGPVAMEAVIARDAVWGISITLLAARFPGNMAVVPLVEIERRTWIPREGHDSLEIQKAIARVDPDATRRARLPPLTEDE